MNITLIAGARPNFMKIAPVIHAIQKAQLEGKKIEYRLVHTGQHYDKAMSETFFEELNIPQPDANLGCGGGTQAEQTAAIMVAFEKELLENPVDLVVVVGDVTSTMACSIVAKKLHTKVAHIEAGIRSGDLSMPEEINRMVTDAILNDKPVKVFNNGNLSRDFTYIDDIVKGVEKTLLNPQPENKAYSLYNIGNGSPVQLLDFIEAIEKETGKTAQKIMMPMQPGDVEQTWADTTALENDFKYKPNTPIQDGIRSFVDWYKGDYIS